MKARRQVRKLFRTSQMCFRGTQIIIIIKKNPSSARINNNKRNNHLLQEGETLVCEGLSTELWRLRESSRGIVQSCRVGSVTV